MDDAARPRAGVFKAGEVFAEMPKSVILNRLACVPQLLPIRGLAHYAGAFAPNDAGRIAHISAQLIVLHQLLCRDRKTGCG